MIVDDCSPVQALVDELELAARKHGAQLHRKTENNGFAKTVNVGLRKALHNDLDAVLVNADIEFIDEGWLGVMQHQARSDGSGLASVVGAKLLYPNGLIQHGGIFFSLLHRTFAHIHQYAPQDLPEAQTAKRCPVTGALQFIRHECLKDVGLYDEQFSMGWEDVDYCLRVFRSGRECVYQPKVKAFHYESLFRGRRSPKVEKWQRESQQYLMRKWAGTSFTEFVPTTLTLANTPVGETQAGVAS